MKQLQPHVADAVFGATQAMTQYGGRYSFSVERTTVAVAISLWVGPIDGRHKKLTRSIDCAYFGTQSYFEAYKAALGMVFEAMNTERRGP